MQCIRTLLTTWPLNLQSSGSILSGASIVTVGLHASMLSTSDTPEITEQITMEEV